MFALIVEVVAYEAQDCDCAHVAHGCRDWGRDVVCVNASGLVMSLF